jgi:hypothetical protein
LRKTLRALCDEYEIFGPLLLPLPESSSEASSSEASSSEAPQSNEAISAATTTTTTTPMVAIATTTGTTTAEAEAFVVAMKRLVEARTLLGELNDDFTAYLFDVQHKQHRDDVVVLIEQMDEKLVDFQQWTVRVDFPGQLNMLLQAMAVVT